MRDSTNRGWDEQFVDQAWGNMRQLLDRELPVATVGARSRRTGVLVLFFLLGLVAGGLGIIHLGHNPAIGYFPIPQRAFALETRQPEVSSVPGSVASVDLPASQRNVDPGSNPEIVERIAHAEKTIARDKRSEPTSLLTNGIFPDRIGSEPPAPVTANLPMEQSTTAPVVQREDTGGLDERAAASEVRQGRSDFTALPELPSSALTALAGERSPGQVSWLLPALTETEASRMHWGAELGGNYYQQPGYFGGVQLRYQLSDRWGLQSGMLYGQMVTGLDNAREAAAMRNGSAAEALSGPNTDLVSNTDQPNRNNATAVNYYNVDIRFQQLSAPMLATYQLNRRWQLGAGVQLHYLLAAKRPVQQVADVNAIGPSYSTFDKQIAGIAVENSLVDTELFQDWNVGAVLGAAYKPADRWSFHLRFQYSPFNWVENERFLITPTNLQLSAAYRLGK